MIAMAGGRQLEFDKEKALAAAMHVFWKQGFVGASLSDLTDAMGINKPSLYATFGNKESLFVQATDHYLDHFARPHERHLYDDEANLRTRLQRYLLAVIAGQCSEAHPKGCYVSLCVAEAAGECLPEGAVAKLHEVGQHAQNLLAQLFCDDPEARRRRFHHDAQERARFLVTLVNGTAALARAGCSRAELESVVERGLAGLGL